MFTVYVCLFVDSVLSEPCYLSNVALHLFLQTEMTVEQIKDYLNGKISEQRVEEIWSNHGKLYHYQAYKSVLLSLYKGLSV